MMKPHVKVNAASTRRTVSVVGALMRYTSAIATPANCENRMPNPTTRPSESSMSAHGSIHTTKAIHGIVPGTMTTRPRWMRYATIGTDMMSR